MKLSARLNSISSLVRKNIFLYDIGTDHAYIPVKLALDGVISRAIASDVNEGPILRARENISSYGLQNIIDTALTDGLSNLPINAPCDIIIAGMGGELIADIINASPIPRTEGARLILQPMTMQHILRRHLIESGFEITRETLVEDAKIYNIIVAEYVGTDAAAHYTELDYFVGRRLIESRPPLFEAYIKRMLAVERAKLDGMKSAGLDISELEKRCIELEFLIK